MKKLIQKCFDAVQPAPELPEEEMGQLAGLLGMSMGTHVYPPSITAVGRSLIFLSIGDGKKLLGIVSAESVLLNELEGPLHETVLEGIPVGIRTAQTGPCQAAWLRKVLPYLEARPLGTRKSAGFGDRLGLATAGHVRAVRKTGHAPIFAQQSVRENERTGRTPLEVLDDAMWGAFQEGWRDGFGADADHLKTTADADSFVKAGYSFYTIDPGAHVDNAAETDSPSSLEKKLAALPWEEMEISPSDLMGMLAERPIDLGTLTLRFTPEQIARAAAKYGKAVWHTVRLYRHLVETMNGHPFELEMSVDETDRPTTPAEHVYIASELKRLKVKWVSLAPRYVGSFEKGVDYIGDLSELEKSFSVHAAIARAYGPYKLSLHSGSDKFSVYPIASRLAGELVHLKTAGTSYLEALRAVARFSPDLFREILRFAVERYPSDRATYHVSAETSRIPDAEGISPHELPGLLENFHAREVLHVTYGSVLNDSRFRAAIFQTLREHEEDYTRIVEAHFDKHLRLFQQEIS